MIIQVYETGPFAKAFEINVTGVENIAKASESLGIPIIHISTDCVFSGNSISSYKEYDLPDGLSR